jgi:hypothetical protein
MERSDGKCAVRHDDAKWPNKQVQYVTEQWLIDEQRDRWITEK